ncbi:MAG: serine/threonine-protein kinase, partial [Lentisphaeria bacterium]
REAKLACRIKHANVIAVMDAERDGKSGLYYIVQEFVDGGTVRDLMRKGPLTEAQALDIAIGVTEALAAAAEFGIVHRDIKPENIMLTRKGVVKLADLGIAKEQSETDTGLTLSQVMMGTPAYMAPEQAHDAKNVDARADLYSLGASLYHMLCGAPPYTGDTAYAVLTKLATEPPPDPRAKRPDLSEPVGRLIQRLMAKKKEERPASAQELLTELKALRNPQTAAGDLQKLAQELITEMRAVRAATATGAAPGATVVATRQPGQAASRRLRPAWWGAAAAAGLLLATGLLLMLKKPAAPPGTAGPAALPPPAAAPGITPPPAATPAPAAPPLATVTSPAPPPAPDLAKLRQTVDGMLRKALAEQELADPRVTNMLDNPARFVSQKLNAVDPVLVTRELVEKRVPIQDVFALLGKPRVGVEIAETVVGKDGLASRDSKIDRFRTALKKGVEEKYGLFIVDVTGERAAQKQQCDILITGNVETAYFNEAVPPALAELGGTTALISYNTAIKVRFLNAVTNQDLDSSVYDFEPKGAEKYTGKSQGDAIRNSIQGAIDQVLPQWMEKLESGWVKLRIKEEAPPGL